MMKKILILFCIVFIAGLSQAQIFENGDFNTGDFTGWWEWVADPCNQTLTIETADPVDATPYAALASQSDVWQVSLGQTAAIGEGVTYDLNFDYAATNATWHTAAISIDYLDSAYGYLGFEWWYLHDGLDADQAWGTYSGTFTVPTLGVAFIDVEFQSVGWGTLQVDNVVGDIVPEPATLALLGLGGVLLRRKRA